MIDSYNYIILGNTNSDLTIVAIKEYTQFAYGDDLNRFRAKS